MRYDYVPIYKFDAVEDVPDDTTEERKTQVCCEGERNE